MFQGFYFKNCEVDREVESYANTALVGIVDAAPYGASVSALIEKNDHRYTGHIEIYSKWGPFLVTATRDNPRVLIDHLVEKMQQKLKLWQRRRYFTRLVPAPPLTQ